MISLQNFLLFAGCSTYSLYLFPVGGVQIAHVLLAMAACIALLNDRIRLSPQGVLLLLLATISFVREGFAVLGGVPYSVLIQPVFILFNLAVLIGVHTIYFHSRSVEGYRWGITIAIGIALASLLMTGIKLTGTRIEERAIGSFQNPNQLAYFAAIMFATTALLYTFERISAWTTTYLIAAILLLALAAQSKAGIVGLSVGLAGLLVGSKSSRIWAGAAVAVVVLLWISGAVDFERLLFLRRLQDIGADPDDSFAARGYFVLVDNARTAFQVWFGLGAYSVRFFHDHEIHSTYASYFGLYGIVGGLIYMTFLGSWVWQIFRTVPLGRFVAIVGPPLLQGIAHNGTRFSIFYGLVALSLALCEERRAAMPRTRLEAAPGWMHASDLGRAGRARMAGRKILGGQQR